MAIPKGFEPPTDGLETSNSIFCNKIVWNEPLKLIHLEIDNLRFHLNITIKNDGCKGGIIIFIKDNLIFLRKINNLRWDDIANNSHVPLRTLEGILYKNTTNPRIETVIRLAKYFNITLDEFVLTDLSK